METTIKLQREIRDTKITESIRQLEKNAHTLIIFYIKTINWLMGELKILKGPKQFQTIYLKKRTGQTLEALDWLRRSFCSKIFEYFLRSFLIIWKRQRDICCKRKFHCHKSKVWQISSTCSTSTQDIVVVSLRSELESGAAVQLSYEVSEKLFSLSSLAPHTHSI